MQDLGCDLDHCFFCRHCMPEWKTVTAAHKKTLIFKRGKPLFTEGEPVTGIFFLYSGIVKIHAPWTDGREMIIRFVRAGEIAGLRGLGGQPAYPISATALEDTMACFVTNEFLELSLKANPSLTYTLMHFYAAELLKAEKRMRDVTHMDVKGRIAGALLDILQSFGTLADGTLALKLTRQDIAAYAGTTYETVFKFFTELTAAGIIATSGKDIQILSPERLEPLAAGKPPSVAASV
ncbi:MAG TPA: Crp/Fnr family transcriptional regulator [Puia sp.]|nr:Crp/Fnr family transcriptional regulator [Puia sp.]